jgi:predicted DNA-binding transcriptional regulator AlpA
MRHNGRSTPRRKGPTGPAPLQLSLQLIVPAPRAKRPPVAPAHTGATEVRLAPMDQRMNTGEVLRIVGVNRSTVFRWVKKGRFPQKHESGGWLRSDVERWLSGGGRMATRGP